MLHQRFGSVSILLAAVAVLGSIACTTSDRIEVVELEALELEARAREQLVHQGVDLQYFLLELGDDRVAVLALDLDDAVAHGPAGAALPLEFPGQVAELILRERQPRDDGDALSLPAPGLTPYTHVPVADRRAAGLLAAPALGRLSPAHRTGAPRVRRVDQSAVASMIARHSLT